MRQDSVNLIRTYYDAFNRGDLAKFCRGGFGGRIELVGSGHGESLLDEMACMKLQSGVRQHDCNTPGCIPALS